MRSADRPEQQFGSWPAARPGRPALILAGAAACEPAKMHRALQAGSLPATRAGAGFAAGLPQATRRIPSVQIKQQLDRLEGIVAIVVQVIEHFVHEQSGRPPMLKALALCRLRAFRPE